MRIVFLYGLIAVFLIACLAGCKGEAGDESAAVVRVLPSYGEAPSLAARVAAGDLPPVEERLPGNPLVVTPVERLGRYGGMWRMVMVGTTETPDEPLLVRTLGYENLVRWDPQWQRVIPNLAQSFEVNDAATVFTLHSRYIDNCQYP